MLDMQRGMRDSLEKYIDIRSSFQVSFRIQGPSVYDFTCFGLDSGDKLSDDRYMIFYNQCSSPEGAIRYEEVPQGARFSANLLQLPARVEKMAFTVSIDGAGTMGQMTSLVAEVSQNGKAALSLNLAGREFQEEKAIIVVEFYRKGTWRFKVTASGYNGGLSSLLKDYGGEEIQGTESQPIQVPQKAEKISLKKGEKVSLSKNEGNKPIRIENGWEADGKDYDLKALVRYHSGELVYVGAANADEVLRTPEGAVCHGGDIKEPGELEHITISWHPSIASVALSSYSALENGTGSFQEYGVFVRIINGNQVVEIPARDTSADSNSYTLCFGEILFHADKSMEVVALEMYSAPDSENRIGYRNGKVVMDIGPVGQEK